MNMDRESFKKNEKFKPRHGNIYSEIIVGGTNDICLYGFNIRFQIKVHHLFYF